MVECDLPPHHGDHHCGHPCRPDRVEHHDFQNPTALSTPAAFVAPGGQHSRLAEEADESGQLAAAERRHEHDDEEILPPLPRDIAASLVQERLDDLLRVAAIGWRTTYS